MRPHQPAPGALLHPLVDQRALLVVSPGGRIQFATARASRWLHEFSLCGSDRVSTALVRWLEKLVPTARVARFSLNRGNRKLSFQVICRDRASICLLMEERAQGSQARDKPAGLTQRQIEVLAWVARGKTNAEIGRILSLKTGTIGKYLERIFPKLGVENRTAAASFVLGANQPL
jgi:DNA-binding CsgD family transcriptional regulator